MSRPCHPLILFALASACSSQPPVLFISRPGNGTTGSDEETTAYYAAMTDFPPEPTLTDWFRSRCFFVKGQDGVFDMNNVTTAFYYNGADLGLGRELLCATCPAGEKRAGLISCSVSNHGVPQGLDLFAFNFADGSFKADKRDRQASIQFALKSLETFIQGGRDPKNIRGATVTFDYDPKRVDKVRMYIYDANTPLLFSAVNRKKIPEALITGLQLDGEGSALNAQVKFMRNCLSCHGGRYDTTTNRILGASFLDFDPVFFNFSNDLDPKIDLTNDPKVGAGLVARCDKNLPKLTALDKLVLMVVQGTGAKALADRIQKNTGKDMANMPNNFFLDVNAKGQCGPSKTRSYVPDGWNTGNAVIRIPDAINGKAKNVSDQEFFKTVVHPYCGSCHFSQVANNNLHGKNGKPITFENSDQWFKNTDIVDIDPNTEIGKVNIQNGIVTSVDLIRKEACGASDMPHAEVTRNNMKRDSLAFAYVCHSQPVQ